MFLALKQDITPNTIVPLPQLDNKLSLVNNNGFYLLGNVCPHQRSKIAKCATERLKCPYHGLEFDIQGQGIDNKFELQQHKCYENQTMVFDHPVAYHFPIDTSFMQLKEQRVDRVFASADVIMDLFLDIPHIPVAHAGVYDQIGITNVDGISWQTFNGGSVQYVPTQDTGHIIESDRSYNIGACWLAIYPGTMIEWQPGAMFVTVAADNNNVYVFKYQDTRYDNISYQFNEKIWETAWAQDRELAESIVELSYDNLDGLKTHHRNWISGVL